MKLSRDITFDDKIQPIALPDENITDDIIQDTPGTKVMLAGWGLAINLTKEANSLEGKGSNSQNLWIVNLLNTANIPKGEFYKYESEWVVPTVQNNAILPC